MNARKPKPLPTACGYDGTPLESDYWCRRLEREIPDECEDCLDVAEMCRDWPAFDAPEAEQAESEA